jgi:tRNA pseudouridine55 synthase
MMEVKYQLNKLEFDKFGRPSGVLLLNKESGISAHDLVYRVRRVLNFDKVGHAGALDTVSSGLMIILVGKATKFSNQLMGMDKEYVAEVVLGISTETQDIEGKVMQCKTDLNLDAQVITDICKSFMGDYEQYVSIFSSVKVDGRKLRKVLRDKRYIYKVVIENNQDKYIELYKAETNELLHRILVPRRIVRIREMEIISIRSEKIINLPYRDLEALAKPDQEVMLVKVRVQCSKGTYIRQLAEDIGIKLNCPASLVSLERTMINNMTKTDCQSIEDLINLLPSSTGADTAKLEPSV